MEQNLRSVVKGLQPIRDALEVQYWSVDVSAIQSYLLESHQGMMRKTGLYGF